jgi:DNA-binding transcriptional MerR regulator
MDFAMRVRPDLTKSVLSRLLAWMREDGVVEMKKGDGLGVAYHFAERDKAAFMAFIRDQRNVGVAISEICKMSSGKPIIDEEIDGVRLRAGTREEARDLIRMAFGINEQITDEKNALIERVKSRDEVIEALKKELRRAGRTKDEYWRRVRIAEHGNKERDAQINNLQENVGSLIEQMAEQGMRPRLKIRSPVPLPRKKARPSKKMCDVISEIEKRIIK